MPSLIRHFSPQERLLSLSLSPRRLSDHVDLFSLSAAFLLRLLLSSSCPLVLSVVDRVWLLFLTSFLPSLPLQAAVATTASTSSAATSGSLGAPGGLPRGAPSPPGPASYNIPSVNEGTD